MKLPGNKIQNASSLKTLTSSTIAFGVFPLSLLLVITASGGPEGYFSLAMIAFEAFGFTVPKYY